jgi:hypothetical protein
MNVGDHLTQEGADTQIAGRLVFDRKGEPGYYVTKDFGLTWARVHRPTYWIARLIEKLLSVRRADL